MTKAYGDIIWRSLFPDVLNGEFTPTSDPTRKHTLARLAIAAYMKGENQKSRMSLVEVRYTPSWASHMSTVVSCEPTQAGLLLTSISLKHEGDDTSEYALDVADDTNEESMAVSMYVGNNDPQTFELELGDKLAIARQAVTNAADAFFAR